MTGEGWPDIATTSMKQPGAAWVGPFFIFFILFSTFALMNLVTGIIVDKVLATARQCQVEQEEQDHMDGKKDYQILRKVFRKMCTRTGEVDLVHFATGLEKPEVVEALKELQIFLGTDPETIFNILDMNGGGTLDEGEFCRGCLRLKGSTQSRHLLFVQNDLHIHSKKLLASTHDISSALVSDAKRSVRVQEHLDQIWHFMRRQASNRWITDPFHSSLHQMISEIYLHTRDLSNLSRAQADKQKHDG